MKILVSNDDGIDSPGLDALIAGLSEHEVEFVVPDGERSASSSALTPREPISAYPSTKYAGIKGWTTSGTPADCVQLGLDCLVTQEPDLVVAGINTGANMGDDLLYSGTVGAAWEGRVLAGAGIAFSINARKTTHWDAASKVVRAVLASPLLAELPKSTVLNVNIPDLPFEQIRGVKVSRIGRRGRFGKVTLTEEQPNDGGQQFMLGYLGEADYASEGTDFKAVSEGWVSITPLSLDFDDQNVGALLQRCINTVPLW